MFWRLVCLLLILIFQMVKTFQDFRFGRPWFWQIGSVEWIWIEEQAWWLGINSKGTRWKSLGNVTKRRRHSSPRIRSSDRLLQISGTTQICSHISLISYHFKILLPWMIKAWDFADFFIMLLKFLIDAQIASFIKQHIFSRRRPIDGWRYMIEVIGPNARKGKGSVSRLPALSDVSTQPFKEETSSLTTSKRR